ncbi:unnamed protein product, partial [Sphacelaria rigidula]
GGPGADGTNGGGGRMLSGVSGIAGSYLGSGLSVMANIVGGVVGNSRERDGPGAGRAPPASLGAYVSGGGGTRATASSLLQHANYGDHGRYAGATSLVRGNKMERSSSGGGGGGGVNGVVESSGISELVARASSNAAMLRQRAMQQQAQQQQQQGRGDALGQREEDGRRGGWPTSSWQPGR